ncbi:MAG: hypothetical protein ACRDHO_08330 [Actinomycetota bacterium]
MPEDPFAGFREDLDFASVSPDVVPVPLPPAGPAEDGERRYLIYLGVFDLLTERLLQEAPVREEAATGLRDLHGALVSVEGPLRFALFEKGGQSESQDLRARMRDREIAITTRWLIPRLEEDIDAYRRRIDALERALGESHV